MHASGVENRGGGPTWDREKGELHVMGQRCAAVDACALCDYLDSLVGEQVGQVIMKNLQTRLGKEDGLRLRKENPHLNLKEQIGIVTEWDRLAGVGASRVSLVGSGSSSIVVEIINPIVKATQGAGSAFLFGWWAGVLSSLLGTDFDYANVTYDKPNDTARCQFLPRNTP